MTSETHTRGPWEMRGPTAVYGNFQRDQNSTCDLVAHLVRREDGPLIEAAPDLLEALVAAESLFAHTFAMDGTVHKQMKAAIAKATGGSQ